MSRVDSNGQVQYDLHDPPFAVPTLSTSMQFGKIVRHSCYRISSADFNELGMGTKQRMYLFDATTVDNISDSWDCERSFCYIGGYHDEAVARGRRFENLHLLIARQ